MGGWRKGHLRGSSTIKGEYPCPNQCGRILAMPGSVARHLRTCATTINQLKDIGGCSDRRNDECWLWKDLEEGQRRRIEFKSTVTGISRRRYVYVVAFILVHGVDPDTGDIDPFVCHTCDDGRCFNPAHLFNGTNQDNLHDMALKGRSRPGFRTMDPERLRQVCSTAGKRGSAVRWNSNER